MEPNPLLDTAKLIIIIGVVLIVIGVAVIFRDAIPCVKHLGRLPGDINIQHKNFSFHFPIVTGIIISIILSLILYIINKLR